MNRLQRECSQLESNFGVKGVIPKNLSAGKDDDGMAGSRIEAHKKKTKQRGKGDDFGRLADQIISSPQLRNPEGIIDCLLYLSKYVHTSSSNLGIERGIPSSAASSGPPPLYPRRTNPFTQDSRSAQQDLPSASTEGKSSPYFNRRAVSRTWVSRSDSMNQDQGTPPMARKTYGTSLSSQAFNRAAERNVPEVGQRNGNQFIPGETPTTRSYSNVNAFDRGRADLITPPMSAGFERRELTRFDPVPSVGRIAEFSAPSRGYMEASSPSAPLPVYATNRLYDEQLHRSSSSSPISSHASHSTGTTILQAAASLRNLPLSGRARGRNEVAEDVLASQILRALQGFEGSYCRLTVDKFRVSPGCSVSPQTRGRLESILFVASLHHELTVPLQGNDLMAEAFFSAVAHISSQFIAAVDAIKKGNEEVQLWQLEDAVFPWRDQLALLATLRSHLKPSIKSILMMNELFYRFNGLDYNPELREVVGSLLDSQMFVFCNLLRDWLAEGSLNVHNREWMVKEKAGQGAEEGEVAMVRAWNSRFTLDKALIPPFLSAIKGLPEMILNTGKCARLLTAESYDAELAEHRLKVLGLELSQLYTQDCSAQFALVQRIQTVSKDLCGEVLSRMASRDKIRVHLAAIRSLFLLTEEKFAMHLFNEIDATCRDMLGVSEARTNQAASYAFVVAARKAGINEMYGMKLPVDAVVMRCTGRSPFASARSPRSRSNVVITPTYKAPRLAAIIINEPAVAQYQTLFQALWPMYSTRLALAVARNKLCIEAQSILRMWKNSSRVLRLFESALSSTCSFFDSFIQFFVEGIHSASSKLSARLDSAVTVEDCSIAHAKFLHTVAGFLFVELRSRRSDEGATVAASALHNVIEEAGGLLDAFWQWMEEIDKERMIRDGASGQRTVEDVGSVTTREFEETEERVRREDAEARLADQPRPAITKTIRRFTTARDSFFDLLEASTRNNQSLNKVLTNLRITHRERRSSCGVRTSGPTGKNWIWAGKMDETY